MWPFPTDQGNPLIESPVADFSGNSSIARECLIEKQVYFVYLGELWIGPAMASSGVEAIQKITRHRPELQKLLPSLRAVPLADDRERIEPETSFGKGVLPEPKFTGEGRFRSAEHSPASSAPTYVVFLGRTRIGTMTASSAEEAIARTISSIGWLVGFRNGLKARLLGAPPDPDPPSDPYGAYLEFPYD